MKKKRSILFIQPQLDINTPRNIRSRNIIKHLAKNYDITILSFNGKAEKIRIPGVNIIREELSFLSKYVFNKSFSGIDQNGILSIFSRTLSYLGHKFFIFPDKWALEHQKMYNRIKKNQTNTDFIVVSMMPFSSGNLALHLKSISGAKIILDIGDPLSFNAVNKCSRKKLRFEKNLLLACDHIIVTNQGTKNIYRNEFDLEAMKISVIPQGADLDIFRAKENPVSNSFKICYAGNFYKKIRDPSAFIEAVSDLHSDEKIRVLFYGSNISETEIDRVSAISLLPGVNQNILAKELSKANVLLYFDNAFGIQTSGKIYELLALKKPILFIYSNESSPVLSEFQHLANIFPVKNEKNSIKLGIRKIKKLNPDNLDFTYDVQDFSWKSRAEDFKTVLERLS